MFLYRFFRPIAFVLIFLSLAPLGRVYAQGGSAVITLVMPVGARQLGMGEAAVAIADDVYGTFWNPGGMAFGPVSNEWEIALPRTYKKNGLTLEREFTAIVTRPRTGFLVKSLVWVGAKDGLLHFNGKDWRDYQEYDMEQGEKISEIVRRYASTGDGLDSLVARVKRFNHIQNTQEEEDLITLKLPLNLIFPNQPITALALDNTDRLWVGTPIGLFRYDGKSWKSFDREDGFTYIPEIPKTLRVDSVRLGSTDSTTAQPDSSAISQEASPNPFRVLSITALAIKGISVWIGTQDGLYEFKKGSIVRRGENLLPTQVISSIAVHPSIEEVYIGMPSQGIARYRAPKATGASAKWKMFGVKDGLLDSVIVGIQLDKYGHLYASHPQGMSHFNLQDWEHFRFAKQEVRSLAIDDENRIWIATSEGAWKYTPPYTTPKGRLDKSKEGANAQGNVGAVASGKGDLIHFHAGNGLGNKNVSYIATQGGDVWFLTGAGVERYNTAKSQVGFFYETLLPALKLEDLYHAFMASTFPIEEWGTLGGFVNYVNFGQNIQTGSNGGEEKKFAAYELVSGLSYATRLTKNLGLGVTTKFIYSALSEGVTSSGEKTDGIAASYAVDLGILNKNLLSIPGLSLGFVMQNMGPAIFYVDQAQSDPIPFTWKLGMAYELFHTPNHRLTVAVDLNREAFYREGDKAAPFWVGAWKEIVYPGGTKDGLTWDETWVENRNRVVYNSGAEYVYANVVAFRGGYLLDLPGQRKELDIGLGFMLSDILQIDATLIKSFDGGIRDNQSRFSMILMF